MTRRCVLDSTHTTVTTTDSICIHCNKPIHFYYAFGRTGFWIHPDLVDVDCHGTHCANQDEDQAEPTPSKEDT